MENKYGLKRYIPEPIKRQIRKECGFGCVVCGNAIAQYEHIDPDFVNARKHDPSKMAYLCGTCHDNVTRGIWSKRKILNARENPKSFKEGVSRSVLDIDVPFTLKIGSNQFTEITNFICLRKKNLLYMESPEEEGAPARLTAYFYNEKGEQSLIIYKNELIIGAEAWDFDFEGSKFTVRNARREIALEFNVEPPHMLTITKLNMQYLDTRVWIEDNELRFKHDLDQHHISLYDVHIKGFPTALSIH